MLVSPPLTNTTNTIINSPNTAIDANGQPCVFANDMALMAVPGTSMTTLQPVNDYRYGGVTPCNVYYSNLNNPYASNTLPIITPAMSRSSTDVFGTGTSVSASVSSGSVTPTNASFIGNLVPFNR